MPGMSLSIIVKSVPFLNMSLKFYLIIAALLQIVWGLVPSASKFVIDEIPIELYIAIRWTISGTIFGLYVFSKSTWQKISLKNILFISFLGILGYGLASFGTLYGLKLGGIVNFALVGALSPAMTSLISILILKERPSKLFLLALPLSVVGLLLLSIGKYQVSSLSITVTSTILILSGFALEACVFVFSKKLKTQSSVTQYLAIAQIAAALFMWSLQLFHFQQFDRLQDLTFKGFTAAIFVSVVACVFCYAILYWLLNYIEGHKLALFDGFHVLSAVSFGLFFFNEEFKPLMLIGGALILVGLVMGNWPKTKTTLIHK